MIGLPRYLNIKCPICGYYGVRLMIINGEEKAVCERCKFHIERFGHFILGRSSKMDEEISDDN